MNVNDRIRGHVASAVAHFTKRHFVSPAPSYASSPVYKGTIGNLGTTHQLSVKRTRESTLIECLLMFRERTARNGLSKDRVQDGNCGYTVVDN